MAERLNEHESNYRFMLLRKDQHYYKSTRGGLFNQWLKLRELSSPVIEQLPGIDNK